MKKLITLIVLFCAGLSFNLSALPTNSNLSKIDPESAAIYDINNVEDFLELTPKKYKQMTGKRMKLKEVIGLKMAQAKVRKAVDAGEMPFDADEDKVIIYLLCFFIPPLAVALVYDIGKEFWTNLILTLLCGLPGVIHAFIVCARYYKDF